MKTNFGYKIFYFYFSVSYLREKRESGGISAVEKESFG